jgi:tRNA threonylcarbamoyladenosine biosynthesis protein TsaE
MPAETTAIPLPNPQATKELGFRLGQCLPAGIVLLLNGELGAGKTTLVQGLGKGLGIQEAIASPTFALIDEYSEGRLPLYHIDLYRLSPAEVADLHLECYWDGREYPLGIAAIEWAVRLPELPPIFLEIDLQYRGDRRIALCSPSEGLAGWPSIGQSIRG